MARQRTHETTHPHKAMDTTKGIETMNTRDLLAQKTEFQKRMETADIRFGPKQEAYLAALVALENEMGADAFAEGRTLVPEEQFTEYAQQTARNIKPLRAGWLSEWPFDHINWDTAANALREDYKPVEFDGTAYLYNA